MKPIEGWNDVPAYTGEVMQLPAGAYKCVVRQASVGKDAQGREFIAVLFDIAEGEYKDFYQKQFDAAQRRDPQSAKWKGVHKQLTQGSSLPFFKGLITSIEKSNTGYVWQWDEKSLVRKFFGGVFGREEFMGSDGKKHMATKCVQIRSVDSLADAKIPEDKLLQAAVPAQANPLPQPGMDGFINIPDGLDAELPFM